MTKKPSTRKRPATKKTAVKKEPEFNLTIDTSAYEAAHGKAPTATQVGNWVFDTPKSPVCWAWNGMKYADACKALLNAAKVNIGEGTYVLKA